MNAPAIRRGRPDEAARLTALAFAAKRHWGYSEEMMCLWAEDLSVSGEYVRSNPLWVAESDGQLSGWYALLHDDAQCTLDALWVEPGSMRRGVGRRLLEHAKEEARRAGAERITVVSDPNAEGFYEAHGFRRIGEVPAKPAGRSLPVLQHDLETC